ncbi:MAG: hypothetical protein ACRCTZ_08300 [Sarcina sp.]
MRIILIRNIYWIGSSLKHICYDIKIDFGYSDFDIIVETSYPKQFEDFLNKKFPEKVYRNSFGGIKIRAGFSNVDVIIINKDLKKVYKNFLEFNFDSFIYDILNEKFVCFDKLYLESLTKVERVGSLIHPKLGTKRSVQRELDEAQLNYQVKRYHGKTIYEAYEDLHDDFFLRKQGKYNVLIRESFIQFIDTLKEF